MSCNAITRTQPLAVWLAAAAGFNLLWEVAQLPLYTLWHDPSLMAIAQAVLHCTAGDVLIATGAFLAGALATSCRQWPAQRPWAGGTVAVTFGVAFTVWSEWRAVYQIGKWAYSEHMPLIFGIGLTPLLQWLIVPVTSIVIFRQMTHTSCGPTAANKGPDA